MRLGLPNLGLINPEPSLTTGAPADALLDEAGNPLLDETGAYILEG